MGKSLTEMAVEIVQAQAGTSKMSPEDIEGALFKTYEALTTIHGKETGQIAGVGPQVAGELGELRKNPTKSIQRNKVISLENGQEFRVITNRHLAQFGLTTREYKKKWGIPLNQPLAAKSLTSQRKQWAKDRGLGEMLKQARAQKSAAKKGA